MNQATIENTYEIQKTKGVEANYQCFYKTIIFCLDFGI